MDTFTIGEVAERTGFSTSALRYYEGIGLVEPVSRTGAGYRIYDETTLARMAFIARAKRLGCTLEEITDLVALWDGDQCGPVQRRFHELVTDKMAATREQLIELTAFAAQLAVAAEHLAGSPTDGSCGDGCACLTEPAATAPTPVALGLKPDVVPIACTLDGPSVATRLEEWEGLLAHAVDRSPTSDSGLRIALDGATPVDELARLVAAERSCCSFLGFRITFDERGLALEVTSPEGAAEVVAAMFGQAA